MANILALVSFRIFPPKMGGQKGVADFLRHLGAFHRVFIVCSKDNEVDGEEYIFPVLENNRRMPFNFSHLRQLSRLIRKHNVHCILAEHSFTGWIAYRLAKKHRLPFVIHNHNIESERFRLMKRWWWPIYRMHEKWIFKKADHLFFISDEDAEYAIKQLGVDERKITVATYGVDDIPMITDAGQQLRQVLDIPAQEKILYFNGTLDYLPNRNAVEFLFTKILPLLEKKAFSYTLVITGNRVPGKLLRLLHAHPQIIFKGFVNDINLFYQGADLFINPVINHAGVKTKLVEALANGCRVVSFRSGASGIRKEMAGDLLTIVNDGDWECFAEEIIRVSQRKGAFLTSGFYEYYNWNFQAQRAADVIQNLARR